MRCIFVSRVAFLLVHALVCSDGARIRYASLERGETSRYGSKGKFAVSNSTKTGLDRFRPITDVLPSRGVGHAGPASPLAVPWRRRIGNNRPVASTLMATPPVAATDCWRPSVDDVERISWGKPAKKKGTGSRGVPHRLNDKERTLYDIARQKGFLEIAGSGWRRERSGKPLVNTFSSWCDARAHPAIFLHKGVEFDEVIIDLAPLRTPTKFSEAADFCLLSGPDGQVEGDTDGLSRIGEDESITNGYQNNPLYSLPRFVISWRRPRPEAKRLAKELAERLGTRRSIKGRTKERGAPRVKPGKSRRHGGYGIER